MPKGLKKNEKDIFIGPHRRAVEFDEIKSDGIVFDSPASPRPQKKPKKGKFDEPPS